MIKVHRDINRLHRRLCIASLVTPFTGALSALCCICGIAVIVLRVNRYDTQPAWWFFLGAAAVTLFATPVLKRRSLPTREQVVSLVDERNGLGGLLMADGIQGSEQWRLGNKPGGAAVSWSNPPILVILLIALIFLLFATWLPMPAIAKKPGVLQIGRAMTRIEEQIDTLESLEMLDEQRAELFRKELEAIEKEKNAENPAATWETIDQLTESINSKVNEELEDLESRLAEQAAMNEVVDAVVEMWDESAGGKDIAAMAASELAELVNSDALTPELSRFMQQALPGLCSSNALASLSQEDMQKLSEALSALSAEELSKLRELFESGLASAESMQGCENARILTAEELRELLRSQCRKCSGGGCSNLTACVAMAVSSSSACQGGRPGDKPGRGGINRGPGHAPLEFSGNTEEDDFLFKLQALPKGSPRFQENKLVGISATAPQVNTDSGVSAGGALGGESSSAAAVSSAVLPQHRKVVEHYFSRNPAPPAKPEE